VNADVRVNVTGHDVFFRHKSGECAVVSLPKNMEVRQNGNNYIARRHAADGAINIAISFYWDDSEAKEIVSHARRMMLKSDKVMQGNTQRWNGYLAKVLRTDMPKTYSRVAVKSVCDADIKLANASRRSSSRRNSAESCRGLLRWMLGMGLLALLSGHGYLLSGTRQGQHKGDVRLSTA
jgi:putative isomerase